MTRNAASRITSVGLGHYRYKETNPRLEWPARITVKVQVEHEALTGGLINVQKCEPAREEKWL